MRLFFIMLLLACGARTDLEVSTRSGADSGRDAGFDAGIPELCNARDDDGDGRVDEDVAPMTCGEGACRAESFCRDGVFPRCMPGLPAMESCNGRDDDCDGVSDEDLGFGPAGEVVEIREEVGGGDECGTCRWATDTMLAPIDGGYLAFWRVGILGGSERPNFWGRRIDPSGSPLGPVDLLTTNVVLHIADVRSDVAPPDMLFTGTERVGFNDDPVWIRIDDSANATVAPRPFDLHPGCRAALVGETVWTGERIVSVCWEEDAVHTVSLRRDGSDARSETIPLPGARGGNVAVWNGQVGVRTYVVMEGGAIREVAFLLLDAQGRLTDGPREVPLEYATWARLIGTEEGWLHWIPQRGPTRWQLLSREGEPLTELVPFDDLRRMGDSGRSDVQLQDPASGQILNVWQSPWMEPDTDLHVEWIDARGNIVRGWSGAVTSEPDAIGAPHAAFGDDGRVRVVWHGSREDDVFNPVYVLEFGCTDDRV